jgi:hypothetical protein
MTRKLDTLFATAAVLMGIATATAAFAQESTPALRSPHTQVTMGDHGGVMGQMGHNRMTRMTRMMVKCNHMMESMSDAPTGPEKERAPATNG